MNQISKYSFFRLRVLVMVCLLAGFLGCNTTRILNGVYILERSDNPIESGKLTIDNSSSAFRYEWTEHLANGFTAGRILKNSDKFYLQSFYDTLSIKDAVVVYKKNGSPENVKLNIHFFVIDSLSNDVIFYLNSSTGKVLMKTDSAGLFSTNNFKGEVTVIESPAYKGTSFKVDDSSDNIYVYLVPNVKSIEYKYFKNEPFELRGNKLRSTNRNLVFRKSK